MWIYTDTDTDTQGSLRGLSNSFHLPNSHIQFLMKPCALEKGFSSHSASLLAPIAFLGVGTGRLVKEIPFLPQVILSPALHASGVVGSSVVAGFAFAGGAGSALGVGLAGSMGSEKERGLRDLGTTSMSLGLGRILRIRLRSSRMSQARAT